MSHEQPQLTDTVVMIRPDYFGFNPETSEDNTFQNRPDSPESEVKNSALGEFDRMVTTLRNNDLRVVVIDSPLGPNGEITPDAVFPNNWFSTHPQELVLYPMKAQNRRWERQPDALKKALLGINVVYPQTIDLRADELSGEVLEGTGSLVLDRKNKIAYAIGSQRTTQAELEKWSDLMGYKPVFFDAVDFGGKPVYHTNVIMSVGDGLSVVCTDAIGSPDQKELVVRSLSDSGSQVVEISMAQMYEMCGNVLQTTNLNGQNLVVMSERARKAFKPDQLKTIERNGLIVPVAIETIETVGGGSARCMMAEIFYK